MRKYSIKHALLKESVSLKSMLFEETEAPEVDSQGAQQKSNNWVNLWRAWAESVDLPIKDAAGEWIEPGGDSQGYDFEATLKAAITKVRKDIFGDLPAGIGGVNATTRVPNATKTMPNRTKRAATYNFDISLNHVSPGQNKGLIINDGSGSNRYATAEVKCLPAQFGQFKREQFASLVWNGTDLVWTVVDQNQKQQIDAIMDIVNVAMKGWMPGFVEHINKTMRNGNVLVTENWHEYCGKSPKYKDTQPTTGPATQASMDRSNIEEVYAGDLGLARFQGEITEINLMENLYNEIGRQFRFNGFVIDNQKEMQLKMPFSDEIDRANRELGLMDEPISGGMAKYIMNGGVEKATAFPGFSGGTGPSQNDSPSIPGQSWIDYLSKTKEIIIFGQNGRQAAGQIFALDPKWASSFGQFNFTGDVTLKPRFQDGVFRLEAQYSLKYSDLPSGGTPFANAEELYGHLASISPNAPQDLDWKNYIKDRYETLPSGDLGVKRKRMSVNPKQPLKFSDDNKLTPELQLQHRKRKYSMTARLLGKK